MFVLSFLLGEGFKEALKRVSAGLNRGCAESDGLLCPHPQALNRKSKCFCFQHLCLVGIFNYYILLVFHYNIALHRTKMCEVLRNLFFFLKKADIDLMWNYILVSSRAVV